jgi:hypothetical protein
MTRYDVEWGDQHVVYKLCTVEKPDPDTVAQHDVLFLM